MSQTPRTSIEQLLLTQAVERSLRELSVPLREHEAVLVESAGLTTDQAYLVDALKARLGELGFRIQSVREKSRYLIKVRIQALGTEQGRDFIGMPPVQSVLLPFALPEITFYRVQHQHALVRWSLDIFETETGTFIRSTPWYEGSTYYNAYAWLFFLNFHTTDLVLMPASGNEQDGVIGLY